MDFPVGDWRISADERARYETYFQQCGPVQGHLTGTIIKKRRKKRTFFLVEQVNKQGISLLNQIYQEMFFERFGKNCFLFVLIIVSFSLSRDLADITSDGRLDKREFAIACYLISSQVNKSNSFF